MPFELLVLLFFIIALIYSMIGFGGGSSYIALLIFSGLSHHLVPPIALICNLIVVTGGTTYFLKYKLIPWPVILPFLVTSIPFAFFAGTIPISQELYQGLLGVLLFLVSLRLLFSNNNSKSELDTYKKPHRPLAWPLGAIIGMVSGLIGIGGGIFLAPLLHLLKWLPAKKIAASAALFIFVNSLAGLCGQMQKGQMTTEIFAYTPLFLAVFLGGQIGSLLCHFKLSHTKIKKITALLILFVSCRLMYNTL